MKNLSKNKQRMLWAAITLGCAYLLVFIAKANPKWVEQLYAGGLYRALSGVGIWLTGGFGFSLAEVLLLLLVAWLLSFVIFAILHTIHNPKGWKNIWLTLCTRGICFACTAYLVFMLVGGLNYYRYSFAYYKGVEVQPASVEELTTLCRDLADNARALSTEVHISSSGTMQLSGNWQATTAAANKAYSTMAQQYEVLQNGAKARPKGVYLSRVMSHSQIVGIYSFYTFEANVNTDVPQYAIPSSIAHELSHSCGFMREDEANYIAYLACMATNNPDFRYSGTLLALTHGLNALAGLDREAYLAIYKSLPPVVLADFAASNAYWQQFQSPYGEFSEKVNDVYLKSNSQSDGLHSYGRMIDLILADRRGAQQP